MWYTVRKEQEMEAAMKELSEMSLEELWQLFPIILREHSAEYAVWYEGEKAALLALLQDYDVYRINHIGSTSVEGLLAKPIVDILLELPEGYVCDAVTDLLQAGGWLLMARDDTQQTLDLNKGYTPAGFALRVFHLHVKPAGDWAELYFRDYLRENLSVAREYAALKQALKEQYMHNRDAYTDAKADFVKEHTQKAREQFAGRYVLQNG